MTAQTLDGSAILATIKQELTARVAALAERGVVPGLGTVLVGDDPGSHWYVGAKHRDCAEIGIRSMRRDLPAGTSLAEVLAVVDDLNADSLDQVELVMAFEEEFNVTRPTSAGSSWAARRRCRAPRWGALNCFGGMTFPSPALASPSSGAASRWAGRSG